LPGLLAVTEVIGTVDADDFIHIAAVEQVERIEGEIEPRFLPLEIDCARESEVPRLEAVALVRIPRQVSNPIGSRDSVIVGIETHKQRKRPRTLKGNDVAQYKVPHERIRRARQREVGNEAVTGILVGRSPFQTSAKYILRNTDESRERPVIQGVRKRITGIEDRIFPGRFGQLQRP
jgi:hypothetical protein